MFGKFSRRHFAKLAGFSALGMAASPAKPEDGEAARGHARASFPDGFIWGTATSAYQIEGAVSEDGRGRSIWDTFAHTPGKIGDRSTADRANDHYHRYKEDVGLIKEAGGWDSRFVCVVAAPEGVRVVEERHPEVKIFAAALDEGLNDRAYIVPGLGDFGDRLFGTGG